MAKKVFIDPEDGKQFTTRKLAKQHMMKQGHKGAIIVEEVETKPTVAKTTSVKSTKKLSDKEKKMEEAWTTYSEFVEKGDKDKVAISKTAKAMDEKEGKIKGWVGTMRGKMRREAKKAKKTSAKKVQPKQPEPEPEPTPPAPTIKACLVLRKEDAEKIQGDLVDGMSLTQNPNSGNIVLEYTNYQYEQLDFLMFKYDFVEVAMTNSDVIFGLNLIAKPENGLNIYDTAQLKSFGIEKMEDGKIIVSTNSDDRLSPEMIIQGLKDANPEKLACVTGLWKKVAGATRTVVNKPTPKTQPKKETTQKKLPAPKAKTSQAYVENFDDWDVSAWVAESYPFSLASEESRGYGGYGGYGGYYGGGYYGRTYTPPKPPEPPTPKSYAVYGVTQLAFAIDRIIPYEKYE
jgi:hypothetical protein